MRCLLVVTALLAAACNSGDGDGDGRRPATTIPNQNSSNPNVPPAATKAERPTPATDSCQSTCAHLELVGPISRLAPPLDDSSGNASVTFGKDHWYVAWGGRPAVVTQLQRFDAGGAIDGSAKKIEGTTALEVLWRDAQSDVVLRGWIPPAYTGAGMMESIHHFDASLNPIGSPILVRTPGVMISRRETVVGADGSLVLSATLGRAVPLVRDIQLGPSLDVNQTPEQRDWFLRGAPQIWVEPIRIDDQFLAAFGDGPGVSVAKLSPGGKVDATTRVLDGPFPSTNVQIWSKRIAGTWWVGGYASDPNGHTTIQLTAVDPGSLHPVGDRIDLTWPSGSPYELLDANGSPVIFGNIETPLKESRTTFVPIDVGKRAACTPSTVVVDLDRNRYQTMRAHHFVGDTAGIVLDTWKDNRDLYFTRIACRP